jgi:acetylornithine deacetylase
MEMKLKLPMLSKEEWKPILSLNNLLFAIEMVLMNNETVYMNKYNIDNNITSNIGKINGGIATNIVPDYCNFCFDIRSYDYNCVQNILNDFKNSFTNNKIKFNLDITCNILPLNNTNNKFNSKSLNFSTEAGFFQNLCNISTIVCGCGDIKQAHQVNEFIETEQIEECCNFLEKLCK